MSKAPTLFSLAPSPVVFQSVAEWLWRQSARAVNGVFRYGVFRPLTLPSAVVALYHQSRDVAWLLFAVVLMVGVLKIMWPAFSSARWSPTGLFERLVTAAILTWSAPWMMTQALAVNNGIVLSFVGRQMLPSVFPFGGTFISPLLVVAVALLLLGLGLYLIIFYVVRAITIFLLLALWPWVTLGWAVSGRDQTLSAWLRETLSLIFVQSLQAGAVWLVGHWLSGSSSLMAVFEEVGLLWFMIQIPRRFRDLMSGHWGR
jgi:hypothetical protein